MFKSPISNNKEKCLPPLGTHLAIFFFFWNFSDYCLKVLSLIIKEIKCLPLSPLGTPLAKKYFKIFFDVYGNFSI